MKHLILLYCLLGCALWSFGQTLVSGKVLSRRGKSITGASIAIKNSYDGGTSDSLGYFHFSTTDTGSQIILITAIGFDPLELPVQLTGKPIELSPQLRESFNELKAVVVTAGSFEAGDAKRTTVLNSIDIVTTASANGDVTGAIKTLPGAQQIGEKEGLFIRGGSGEEARVFIDGTLVNNFFYSSIPDIATRGRFSPFLFKGTIFSSGGYSALYGQALSGALILETIDFPERSSANLGLSTVGLSAGYQQVDSAKTRSWGVNYAYNNLQPYFAVAQQRVDYFTVPAYHFVDANFRIRTSKTGILKFYGTFQANQLGLRFTDIDSGQLKNAFSLKNHNIYGNLSWKEKLGKQWKIFIGSSFSNNLDQLSNALENEANEKITLTQPPFRWKPYLGDITGNLAQVKTVLDRKIGTISTIRFGGEYQYFFDEIDFTDSMHRHTILRDQFTAAFAEADIYLSNNLAAKIGSRLEHSSLLSRSNWAPRISLAYKLADASQFSFAYGVFYQKPERNQMAVTTALNYTRASHYILNFQQLNTRHSFRVEAFYKKYEDLVKTSPFYANNGFGYAKGIEIFWRDKKTFKGVDYWISYSYLDTKRDYLNYPIALQPNFAANHTASLVVKKFITKWKTQFNGAYNFATGRPYYDLRLDESGQKFVIADQGTTKAYNNLSLSVNYIPAVGKANAKRFTVWVLSITNVLNQGQVFNYNYSYNGTVKKAVVPPANRFFFLGCFISFGVDRTEDVINSNL